MLKTVFFLHSICLARARTSEPAAVRDQVFDKKKSKVGRKRVANPHELVENLAANLVQNQLQTWFSTRFAPGYNNGMWPLEANFFSRYSHYVGEGCGTVKC